MDFDKIYLNFSPMYQLYDALYIHHLDLSLAQFRIQNYLKVPNSIK